MARVKLPSVSMLLSAAAYVCLAISVMTPAAALRFAPGELAAVPRLLLASTPADENKNDVDIIVSLVVVSAVAKVFLKVLEMVPAWGFGCTCYSSKDRLKFTEYKRRVRWEFTVNTVGTAVGVAAFAYYVKGNKLETGIVFFVNLMEILARAVASTKQIFNLHFACSKIREFMARWDPDLDDVKWDAAGSRDKAWDGRLPQHIVIPQQLSAVPAIHVQLLFCDWHRLIAHVASAKNEQVWQSILVSYSLFQAGATKAFAHAWSHSIVIQRIVAADIFCQSCWAWRNPRLRYFDPMKGPPGCCGACAQGEVIRVPQDTHGYQQWLVDDTFQLDMLEHVVLWLLAWDVHVMLVLSHVTLQMWWEFCSKSSAVQGIIGEAAGGVLSIKDAFAMDVAAHCGIAGGLALAKSMRDEVRSQEESAVKDLVWEMGFSEALQLCALSILLELHTRLHNIAEDAHVYKCAHMQAASAAWVQAKSVPKGCEEAVAALKGCKECQQALQGLEKELKIRLATLGEVDVFAKES